MALLMAHSLPLLELFTSLASLSLSIGEARFKPFEPKTSRRLRATHEDHRCAHACCSMGRPDCPTSPSFLHQSHGSGCISRSLHGQLCLPRLGISGDLHR